MKELFILFSMDPKDKLTFNLVMLVIITQKLSREDSKYHVTLLIETQTFGSVGFVAKFFSIFMRIMIISVYSINNSRVTSQKFLLANVCTNKVLRSLPWYPDFSVTSSRGRTGLNVI